MFACGNVLHVHDLVDYVSQEAAQAGKNAAAYLRGNLEKGGKEIPVRAINGVRYTVPAAIDVNRMEETLTVRFRVGNVYRNAAIEVSCNGQVLKSQKKQVLAPGEMEQVILKKSELESIDGLEEITIAIRTEV